MTWISNVAAQPPGLAISEATRLPSSLTLVLDETAVHSPLSTVDRGLV
jgi:hypothetical protein